MNQRSLAEALAYGTMLDATLTFVALARERGIDSHEAVEAWKFTLSDLKRNFYLWVYGGDCATGDVLTAMLSDAGEHIEAEIARRRELFQGAVAVMETDDAEPGDVAALRRETLRDGDGG